MLLRIRVSHLFFSEILRNSENLKEIKSAKRASGSCRLTAGWHAVQSYGQ